MATSKILILTVIFTTHYVSYSTGSLENQARELCLSQKVASSVSEVCPEKNHKFDTAKNNWKRIRKLLYNNRIKDLTRFEPDTATVDAYTNLVCSGELHGQILRFPSLSDTPRVTLDGNDSINSENEESYDETKMSNFGLNEDSSASYFDVKINAISFILGSFIGALFAYFSTFRSAQSVIDVKKLRRPEL